MGKHWCPITKRLLLEAPPTNPSTAHTNANAAPVALAVMVPAPVSTKRKDSVASSVASSSSSAVPEDLAPLLESVMPDTPPSPQPALLADSLAPFEWVAFDDEDGGSGSSSSGSPGAAGVSTKDALYKDVFLGCNGDAFGAAVAADTGSWESPIFSF